MKKLILLFAFVLLSSCSASDSAPSCTSKCKFTTDLSSNKFFYVDKVTIDCSSKIPSAETLKKIQDIHTQTVIFCGCD